MDTPNHDKEVVLAQILYLYITPTLLLYYGIIPGHFRLVMLFSIALLLYGIIKHAKWTYSDIGIQKGLMKDIIPYTIFTLVGIAFLFLIAYLAPKVAEKRIYLWWENLRFLILFIPISVLQEIVFRGILMHLLVKAFKNPIFIIILNASLFALIHIIYLNSIIVLPLTFLGGIAFAWIYYKYPNLILVSLSHTVLNFTAMILGFFVLR
jgi:membrane protease YdiL (CAAX protease family)